MSECTGAQLTSVLVLLSAMAALFMATFLEPPSPTHSHFASPTTTPIKTEDPAEKLSLDKLSLETKSEDIDPGYAAALARQKERELAEAKLFCSLENKEACLMCSG